MSAPSSRRKAKKRFIAFPLIIEGQEMIVQYQPDWMTDVGHFEFRSPHEPPRRIPVSETGYRSHFAAMHEVEASASPQDYAREVTLDLLGANVKRDRDQLALF